MCVEKADALLGMGILKVAVCLKRKRKMNEMCEAQISGQTLQNFMPACYKFHGSDGSWQLGSHCWSWHLYSNLYKNIQFQRVPAQTANSMERSHLFSAVCLILHPFPATLLPNTLHRHRPTHPRHPRHARSRPTSDTLGDIPPATNLQILGSPTPRLEVRPPFAEEKFHRLSFVYSSCFPAFVFVSFISRLLPFFASLILLHRFIFFPYIVITSHHNSFL